MMEHMAEQSKINESGTAEKLLQEFIDTKLSGEIKQLRMSFREPLQDWFRSLRDSIQRIKKSDENYYRQSLQCIDDRMPELQSTLQKFEEDGWHIRYRESIASAVEILPEVIKERQGDVLFTKEDGDSIVVRAGKSFKRLKRKFSGKPLTRQVELKSLAARYLTENRNWIEEMMAREYDECAMLIDLLLEKKDKSSEEKTGEKGFKFDIFVKLEEHLNIAVQHLKQVEESNDERVRQYLEQINGQLRDQARKAGTFEHSSTLSGKPATVQFSEDNAQRFGKVNNAWVSYLRSQYSDIRVQIEIARYGIAASATTEGISELAHIFFRDAFYLPIEKGVEATKKTAEALKNLESKKGITGSLEKLRVDLEQELNAVLLEPMREKELLEPIGEIQNQLGDLQAESRLFTEELHLAEKRESNYPLPVLEMDTIRWQMLAARYMKEEAIKKLDPGIQDFEKLYSTILAEVEEAAQIVDVNIMAAIGSVEDGEEAGQDPMTIALEGLERAINTLEKSIKQVREKQNGYLNVVGEKLPAALHTLAGTMHRREFDYFEIQDKALMVKEHASNWQQKLSAKWAVVSEKIELVWRFLFKKAKHVKQVVSRFLGFKGDEVISTREKRNLTESLARLGVESELPFVYKRLFDRGFSIDERFYVSPKNGTGLISSAYEQWSRGLSANVAIIGEKGSGKTTMIRFAGRVCYPDADIDEVQFDNTFTDEKTLLKMLCNALGFKLTESRDEFLEKVQRKRKPSVVVVENLQNIFIRNIKGYEALESFWVIMSSTIDKLFWVVSCSRYSWNFFVKMSNADQYFTHVVETDQLAEDEIREAILSRHKSTGYELYFEPADHLKNSRAFKKLAGDDEKTQKLVREYYFSRLSKICEGNTSIAMIFWLQSIKEFDNQKFVFQPLEITDVDKLEVPSKEVLFTLSALVIHDKLTQDEVALALHQDSSESGLMLARLKTKGIVYFGNNNFGLNHLVYRQVIRLLKRRNIIH